MNNNSSAALLGKTTKSVASKSLFQRMGLAKSQEQKSKDAMEEFEKNVILPFNEKRLKGIINKGLNTSEALMKTVVAMRTSADVSSFIDIQKELIKAGADVNYVREDGKTPLIVAGAGDLGKIEGVKFLLENGANVNDSDLTGKSALSYVIKEDIIEVLRKSGARGGSRKRKSRKHRSKKRNTRRKA
jgi:hypothetical protein